MNAETENLVPSISIVNLVNQRNAVIERLNQAAALIAEAECIAANAHVGMPRIVIDDSYQVRGGSGALSGVGVKQEETHSRLKRRVDGGAWSHLMNESGMRTFMDAATRKRWDEQINEGNFPELNVANIEATFQLLHESRLTMLEEGVIQCFKGLSWHYKTNQPYKFGKRVIVTDLHSGYGFKSYSTDTLDDLVRVFCLFENVPQPDYRHSVNSMLHAAWCSGLTSAEHEYFTIRWFKKGTGHIVFKRLDLVDRLNLIIAKHFPGALPCSTPR